MRDSGIVHVLLGIATREQLMGHPVVGSSWEGLVVKNVLLAVPAGSAAFFYWTAAGAEIDLVLGAGVKRSLRHPEPARGFHLACDGVTATRRVVVYPGTEGTGSTA